MAETQGPADKSMRLLEKIEELGLDPYEPPPLPPIDLDEVHLVCWMAIEKEEA